MTYSDELTQLKRLCHPSPSLETLLIAFVYDQLHAASNFKPLLISTNKDRLAVTLSVYHLDSLLMMYSFLFYNKFIVISQKIYIYI